MAAAAESISKSGWPPGPGPATRPSTPGHSGWPTWRRSTSPGLPSEESQKPGATFAPSGHDGGLKPPHDCLKALSQGHPRSHGVLGVIGPRRVMPRRCGPSALSHSPSTPDTTRQPGAHVPSARRPVWFAYTCAPEPA